MRLPIDAKLASDRLGAFRAVDIARVVALRIACAADEVPAAPEPEGEMVLCRTSLILVELPCVTSLRDTDSFASIWAEKSFQNFSSIGTHSLC